MSDKETKVTCHRCKGDKANVLGPCPVCGGKGFVLSTPKQLLPSPSGTGTRRRK